MLEVNYSESSKSFSVNNPKSWVVVKTPVNGMEPSRITVISVDKFNQFNENIKAKLNKLKVSGGPKFEMHMTKPMQQLAGPFSDYKAALAKAKEYKNK